LTCRQSRSARTHERGRASHGRGTLRRPCPHAGISGAVCALRRVLPSAGARRAAVRKPARSPVDSKSGGTSDSIGAAKPLMATPHVTVLMTAYNRAEFIGPAIESVLAQTYAAFDLLIVDDCSSDATLDIARHYERR